MGTFLELTVQWRLQGCTHAMRAQRENVLLMGDTGQLLQLELVGGRHREWCRGEKNHGMLEELQEAQ